MEEWANPQTIGAVAALVVAVVTSLTTWLKDRRSAPIDRKTAEMATTTAITVASKSTIETALAISERSEKDFEDERKKVGVWERWYDGLVGKWHEVRHSEQPPARPIYNGE